MSIAASAQTFPSSQGYVSDFAGLLSPASKAQLEARLSQLEKETTVEIAVVTIKSLEGHSVEDYASRLFEQWGVGKKGKDNGVLFLVAAEDREVRIEVGYGLESVITDGRAGRILDNDVVPHFKNGDYETGILSGVGAIEIYARGGTSPEPAQGRGFPGWLLVVIFALFFGGIIAIIVLSAKGIIKSSGGKGGSSLGGHSSHRSSGSRSFGGGRSGGGGASRKW